MEILSLVGLIIYRLLGMLLSPIFWVVILVIGWQMQKMAKMKSDFFHVPKEKMVRKTVASIFLGLLGGLVGSLFLVGLGVSVFEVGIEYLWIIAIILFLFRQRWMCFAYAGSLIVLANCFVGWPDVNVAHLLALVAILHLVEAMLVYVGGHLRAMPVYTMGKNREIIGGFMMQNFWPLPLIALSATLVPMQLVGGDLMEMPHWWPILGMSHLEKSYIPGMMMIYAMVPVLAALGYSDLSLTMTAKQKTKKSALALMGYSLILLFLAVLTDRYQLWAIIAAVFSFAGHEALIHWGQKKEMDGNYMFIEPLAGAKILDVLEGYPAKKAGLQTGDIIVEFAGKTIGTMADLAVMEEESHTDTGIVYMRDAQKKEGLITVASGENLGIIYVPSKTQRQYFDFTNQTNPAKTLWKKIKRLKTRQQKMHS